MNLTLMRSTLLAGICAGMALIASSRPVLAQEPARPTFSAGVAVVPITALVRDSRNRIVRNLGRDDFQVLEQGAPRRIVEFTSREDAPVSVAFVFDTSGSMNVASNLAKGKQFVAQFLNQMNPAFDEAALFTFHRSLRQEVSFTSDRSQLHQALDGVRPWGLTSLYDAVAETAKELADRPALRRAVVVISDGVDTSSALTSEEVSALASAIDVPVYVIAVVSRLDEPGYVAQPQSAARAGALSNLAHWTGGDLLYVNAAEQASPGAASLMTAMRQQYFLAIESSSAPGWYSLEVKTRQRGLSVRSRRGYFAGSAAAGADGSQEK